MYTRWTSHLNTDEEKEIFKRDIYSAKNVLERLTEIINEDESILDRSEEDQRIYDNPNWDYRQAHKNGNRQYMRTVRLYTDLDQQKGSINDERSITRIPRLGPSR
jgi:predicted Zn-dependent protease